MNPLDWRLVAQMSKQGAAVDFEEGAALRSASMQRMQFGVGMVLVFGGLSLGGLVYFASYSGSLRWVLAFLVAVAAALVLLRFVQVDVRDPEDGHRRGGLPGRRPGEIGRFARVLERAAGGLKFSQVMAEERLRDALLHQAAVLRALSPLDIEAARRDAAALRGLLEDGELAAFVLRSDQLSREWPGMISVMPRRPEFWREYRAVLAKGVR